MTHFQNPKEQKRPQGNSSSQHGLITDNKYFFFLSNKHVVVIDIQKDLRKSIVFGSNATICTYDANHKIEGSGIRDTKYTLSNMQSGRGIQSKAAFGLWSFMLKTRVAV